MTQQKWIVPLSFLMAKQKMDSAAILSDDVAANDSTKVRLTYLQTRTLLKKVNISYGFK